jgi:hypothetical protein
MPNSHQLAFVNEALKRFVDQLFPVVPVIKDLPPHAHAETTTE